MKNRLALSAVALSLLMIPASAQQPGELMQKGLYQADTAGDFDAAIQTYRQILGSGPDRLSAAQAQYELTRTLLRKGDVAGASHEFAILSRDYQDFGPLVDSMEQRARSLAESGPAQMLGAVEGGRYHHNWTGVEVTMPAGWVVGAQRPRTDGGDRMDIVDSATRSPVGFLWMIRRHAASAEIPNLLQSRLQSKLHQRGEADGYHHYKYRANSVQPAMFAGQQGMTAIGDYGNDQGEPMIEWLVFVNTGKTRLFLSIPVKAADYPVLQQRAAEMMSGALIP